MKVKMADPASLARSISEAVSRAISETVNATLAQVGMQPEIQQWRIWVRGPGTHSPHPPRLKYLLCRSYSLNNSAAHTATGTTTQRPR